MGQRLPRCALFPVNQTGANKTTLRARPRKNTENGSRRLWIGSFKGLGELPGPVWFTGRESAVRLASRHNPQVHGGF
jgi:hypothetical protein